VFGLPVVALQVWGRSLGGREAGRWVGGFQALLAGWVLYVAAAGMLFEGLLQLRRGRLRADLIVATAAAALYIYSAVTLGRMLFAATPGRPMFDVVVILLAAWCRTRWVYLARRLSRR
jgi:cation transport ATPase